MSKNYILYDDVRGTVIYLVRGYNRRKKSKFPAEADAQIIKAFDIAFEKVGRDIASKEVRAKFKNAIIDSCQGGRFNFDYAAIPMSRSGFYYRRRKFLFLLAENMGMVS